MRLVVLVVSLLLSPGLSLWDGEVYCGRQWDDLFVTPAHHLVPPGILALYSPQCTRHVTDDGLTGDTIPPAQFLVYAKHDYHSTSRLIWYKLDKHDDLAARYHPEYCPTHLYFADGRDLTQATDQYEPDSYGVSLMEWLWSKMSVNITIQNKTGRKLVVVFTGNGPQLPVTSVNPRMTETLSVFVSYIVVILYEKELTLCYGFEVTRTSPQSLTVGGDEGFEDYNTGVWLRSVREQQGALSLSTLQWRFELAKLQLRNFKQPVLLRKFTATGYQKFKIPQKVYNKILYFYHKRQKLRQHEPVNQEPSINNNQVLCTVVQLSPDLSHYVGGSLRTVLELWAGVPLTVTSVYGIREYYHGNVLRSHVDIAPTHVISAILQITQELDRKPNWDLEIIGFDGIRRNVTLEPGQMLLYESATLVHGRPFPFQGQLFANAFLHYKPVAGWDWDLDGIDHYLMNNGEVVDDMYKLVTPNLERHLAHRKASQDNLNATHQEL